MRVFRSLFAKQAKITMEFCRKNLDRFVAESDIGEYEALLSRKNVIYKEYECQSRCEECLLAPYAVVDGEFVQAENSAHLLAELKKRSN